MKVRPPSVESEIFTRVVLSGAAEVPTTSQVTVWVEPFCQVAPAAGCVITNGSASLSTVVACEADQVPVNGREVETRRVGDEDGLVR